MCARGYAWNEPAFHGSKHRLDLRIRVRVPAPLRAHILSHGNAAAGKHRAWVCHPGGGGCRTGKGGGYFVEGLSGAQFARPGIVDNLRSAR
jgi:hypothetical protein